MDLNISSIEIENRIFSIRGNQVMIDNDLAEIYCVETKRLNEQVRRNIDRFPENYRFQLSNNEKTELVANCDRLKETLNIHLLILLHSLNRELQCFLQYYVAISL